ncbi:Uncharacterized protein TCM_042359 [Theobroma cacao]|uniref:Uncharacterized protein n=1 Tax=Theobroma cacao TaxID=3641 RepID=A0A061FJM3_THECC|nr:Uncharacterized protein TCM_042359 [Theobroma cacao]
MTQADITSLVDLYNLFTTDKMHRKVHQRQKCLLLVAPFPSLTMPACQGSSTIMIMLIPSC